MKNISCKDIKIIFLTGFYADIENLKKPKTINRS